MIERKPMHFVGNTQATLAYIIKQDTDTDEILQVEYEVFPLNHFSVRNITITGKS